MFEIISVDELLKRLENYNHKELHLHHTYNPDHKTYSSRPDGIYWQEAMQRYHVKELGWSDIGQHVTLLPDGNFVTGRDFGKDPASIKGYNKNAFAVEMIGNFDLNNDPFEGAQRASALKLAAWFDKRGRYIRFHRDNSPKTCPGTGIDKVAFLKEVRNGQDTANLMPGSRGEEVKWLQQSLNKLGYNAGAEDGIFGSRTQAAVIAFQKANGLVPDGIVGPKTRESLGKALNGADGDKSAAIAELRQQVDALASRLEALNAELDDIKNKLSRL
jgi:hypothetical protein